MNRSVSRPNLFTYATKELSQDAMICWLIKWSEVQADDECGQALRDLGRAFAGALLGKHHQSLAGNIKRVEIHQQDHGIDVLARIEDESTERVLLIEDKTGTSDHSGQLKRYRDAVKNGVTNLGNVSEHWPIYLKTGNQSRADDRRIENETGFKVFRREDFLMLLENYPVSNPIVTDFRKHLQEIEDDFNGFNDWKRDDRANWSWGAWEGFYRRLERKLDDGTRKIGWGYVANRAGGFLGFWWWSPGDAIYLQIEADPGKEAKLCFKVDAEGKTSEEKDDLKWRWHERVLTAGRGQVVKPKRMMIGNWFTVAWWKDDWMAFGEDGKLDIHNTVENLEQATAVLKTAMSSSS